MRKVIYLSGNDGNAFALLGYASRFAKQLDMSKEETKAILDEMMSGDYDNLLAVFENHFGEFVELAY